MTIEDRETRSLNALAARAAQLSESDALDAETKAAMVFTRNRLYGRQAVARGASDWRAAAVREARAEAAARLWLALEARLNQLALG